MYQASNVIETAAELRHVLGEAREASANKVIDHIDVHCRAWIERAVRGRLHIRSEWTDGRGAQGRSCRVREGARR